MRDRNPEALARKLNIERANLAYALVNPESVGETVSMLTPRDFEPGFNRSAFQAIVEAYESGAPTAAETFFLAVKVRLQALLPDMPHEELAVKMGLLIGAP